MYTILLYYKYVTIKNPEEVRDWMRTLCEGLGMKGRILIAYEGINGTVEGDKEQIASYKKAMKNNPLFSDVIYKESSGNGNAFPKLVVKIRPELVTGGLQHIDPNKKTGKYITSDELHKWYEEKKEFYLVDMRNDFEYASGYFENFIPSGMKHFRDIKNVLPKLEHLKVKTVVTVCTGGIRCEKASGFLVENGFMDVYQLKDGIHTYMEKYPNQHFKGKLYVFDNRLLIGFHTEDPKHEIVGKCMICHSQSENYVNCGNDECHLHIIACENCKDKDYNMYFCSSFCKETYETKIQTKQLVN